MAARIRDPAVGREAASARSWEFSVFPARTGHASLPGPFDVGSLLFLYFKAAELKLSRVVPLHVGQYK